MIVALEEFQENIFEMAGVTGEQLNNWAQSRIISMIAVSERYDRIFLLSHMRALTSLAGHILDLHPQINGYYEMHISYENASDLAKV